MVSDGRDRFIQDSVTLGKTVPHVHFHALLVVPRLLLFVLKMWETEVRVAAVGCELDVWCVRH